MKDCRKQQIFYVGEVIYAKLLIINEVTGARIDSGTLPTAKATNSATGTIVLGTCEWITGGVDDSPTAIAYFTLTEPGLWEAEVKTSVPFVGIERINVEVFA